MNAIYRISEDDYVNAMKLFSRLTQKSLLIHIVVAAVLVILAIFGSQVVRGAGIGGLVGGGFVLLVGRFIASPILSRRHYRKYKAIQEEFTVELLDQGVRFTSPNANGILKWEHILKWRQNDQYILIYPMPRIYHIVPKRVLSTEFDIEMLTTELSKHVGTEA